MLLTQDSAPQASGGSADEPMPPPAPEQLLASDAPPQAEVIDAAEQRLRFTGSGAEYFRIWAVNLTLTVLTLGLYSAWAKVRRLQYFYQHTELDGSAFDYTANPIAILFGRVIALGLLVTYYLAFGYAAWAGLASTLLLAAVLPVLLRQSFRFKARNTRFLGLNFGFDGNLSDAYKVYLPIMTVLLFPPVLGAYWLGVTAEVWVFLLSLLALLFLPILQAVFRRYIQSNLRFGCTGFVFAAKTKDFLKVWLWSLVLILAAVAIAALVALVVFVLVGAIYFRGKLPFESVELKLIFGGSAMAGAGLSYLLLSSYFTARFQNLVWNKTSVGPLHLQCEVPVLGLLRVQCTNTLWIVLTLGLYRPFAAVRLARYRLAFVRVSGWRHLDEFSAGEVQSRRGATGEGAAELFEMDVGL